jgi:hypothetical protein
MNGIEKDLNIQEDGKILVGPSTPTIDLPPDVMEVAESKEAQGVGTLAATTTSQGPTSEYQSMLPLILEKIHDPNYPLAEVNRLIAIEIGFIAQEMSNLHGDIKRGDYTNAFNQRSYDQRVKAMQALEKSLTSADILRNRDILNFDGPKFVYVFGEVVEMFKKACQDALGRDGETMVQSIMKHYRDAVAMREAELRRQTEKIDSKTNQ